MKWDFRLVLCIAVLFVVINSCHKYDEVRADWNIPIGNPAPGTPASSVHRDYYWGLTWQQTARGYEIAIDSWKITDSAINRGINVHLAIFTEMTTFQKLPLSFYDQVRRDSVHLSYTATRGQILVLARATFNLNYASDVMIEYQ